MRVFLSSWQQLIQLPLRDCEISGNLLKLREKWGLSGVRRLRGYAHNAYWSHGKPDWL